MSCCQCPPQVPRPIWPSNSGNELLYSQQRLFSQDNHNHDQVLGEHTYNLPLAVPQNLNKPPVLYVNGYSGKIRSAPFSSDNQMHQDWVPFRLYTNVNTPFGSDSNLFFQGVKSADTYTGFKDWLDSHNDEPEREGAIDERVAQTCNAVSDSGLDVCTPTCVDWWTNRPVPQQGSMSRT